MACSVAGHYLMVLALKANKVVCFDCLDSIEVCVLQLSKHSIDTCGCVPENLVANIELCWMAMAGYSQGAPVTRKLEKV